MGMNRAEIDRLILEEVAGKKMVPTEKVPINPKLEFNGVLKEEEKPIMRRLGENENGKLIVVKDSQVFEVEIRRK
jgi:hypothetical protein